jgi:hypothetical protein
MPFRIIPGLDLQYGLLSYDEDGKERADDPAGGLFSETILARAAHDKPTDIFLFVHGWKGAFPDAVDQYDRWIGAMWRSTSDREAMGSSFTPLFLGLHWPSQPWGDEKLPGATSFAVSAAGGSPAAAAAAPTSAWDALYERTVAHFGDTSAVRESLGVIFDAQKASPGSDSPSPTVIAAYHRLADAIGFAAHADASAPPDTEGAAFDPAQAIRAMRQASAAVPAGVSFSSGGGFSEGILGALRQLSFWTMKKRARTVGEGGMHTFVAKLQQTCGARLHLMGHSFGCIVVSSIVGGPNGQSALPRPVDSLALVQGALSLWAFGDHVDDSPNPGYFQSVLHGKRVAGPVVTTQSVHDLAVGVYYPAAVYLVGQADFDPTHLPKFGGVGSFGIQGTNIARAITMLDTPGTYSFKPGVVYNIESSAFIKKMDGASGAHSDIDGPQVAHMLWQAALTSAEEPS